MGGGLIEIPSIQVSEDSCTEKITSSSLSCLTSSLLPAELEQAKHSILLAQKGKEKRKKNTASYYASMETQKKQSWSIVIQTQILVVEKNIHEHHLRTFLDMLE
ncbi:uncharacterized protein A4U43_C06F11500 [Asparagus officinalis]|uniref:Uncharacterized protein n=1 Tax=Asparagus officinalis TaxID=4686 RepID=A0A5P1ELT5_ASPOF|nr:uncharacterized protein A4U43_C06F11500 [Asparagus officinalis]